ncbi:MAG: FecR domain-containing protein [Saprospiraceae bacterium]|nr:FecR domain-containing protein [Saprospiraceae bacterium]
MNFFDEKTDELLAKHLAGESSPEEDATLARWLEESPTHRRYFDELQWLWERSPQGKTPSPRALDTEAALRRVKDSLNKGHSPTVALRWQRSFWLRAAAAVLVLAVAAVLWFQRSASRAPLQLVAANTALSDTLTDGSVVRLAPRSGLTVVPGFNRRERRLRLQGEAFFQVAPDTARPFVVEVQALEVQVVGTAFTVDNSTAPNTVFVRVSEGKVRVQARGQMLLLLPGEGAEYDIPSGRLQRIAPEQGVPSGKNRVLYFESTPLLAVVEQINTRYDTHISIKNKNLENCPLTARYNDLPLDRVLELIAESFSIRVEKTGDGYVLDGPGCDTN